MTKQEQIEFVNMFIDAMKERILSEFEQNNVSENWNGFELRHWINIIFDRENVFRKKDYMLNNRIAKRRKKDCENDIIVNNL